MVKVETKLERSLILYLESRAVDNSGLLDNRQMNKEDMDLCKKWNEIGFIKFGRVPFNDIQGSKTHYAILTPEAFAEAHKERVRRSTVFPCKYGKEE